MSLEIKQSSTVNIETIPATYEDWKLSITKTSNGDGTLKNIIVNGHKAENAMDSFRVEHNYEANSLPQIQMSGYDAGLLEAIMDLVNGTEE